MASLRCHVRIARPADEVWALVSDPARIVDWFPGMEAVVMDGRTRTLTLRSGLPLVEEVVNVDARLRRFQYRITGPLPVTFHLGTIDVLEDGEGCLVVYSTEIDPEPMAFVIDGAVAEAVEELRRVAESATRGGARAADPSTTGSR